VEATIPPASAYEEYEARSHVIQIDALLLLCGRYIDMYGVRIRSRSWFCYRTVDPWKEYCSVWSKIRGSTPTASVAVRCRFDSFRFEVHFKLIPRCNEQRLPRGMAVSSRSTYVRGSFQRSKRRLLREVRNGSTESVS
jgi:hypothetical protein